MVNYFKVLGQMRKLSKYMERQGNYVVITDHEGLKENYTEKEYQDIIKFVSDLNKVL